MDGHNVKILESGKRNRGLINGWPIWPMTSGLRLADFPFRFVSQGNNKS